MHEKHNLSIKVLCTMVGLSESTYCYRVVQDIKQLLSHEFIDCGYRIMTAYLKRDGYLINHKKVYRIMGNSGLLKPDRRIKRCGGGRKVEYRSFGEIQQILKRYVPFYNNLRIHGKLGRLTPRQKWEQEKHLISKAKTAA